MAFPDEIEAAAGTDSLNAAKTPFDDQTRGMVNAINVTAKLITLNLAKDGRDSLLLTGELSVPADFVATDKTVIFDIAGKIRSFVLKKNGSAGKSVERLQLKIKRLKVPASQSAPFTLKTTRDSLKERLANNAPLDGNGFATQVTVVLLFNNTYYQSVLPLSFQAQKNPTLQVSK